MKIQEFINENSNSNILQAINYIKQHCSQSLNDFYVTGRVLSRYCPSNEINSAVNGIIFDSPRSDRRPKDSTIEAQQLIDSKLSAAGFSALRGNSLFVYPDKLPNGLESDVNFLIFPENGFKFTTSEIHQDMTNSFPLASYLSKSKYIDAMEYASNQTPQEFIKLNKFYSNNFTKALLDQNEIYILGNYVGLKRNLYWNIILEKLFCE